MSRLTVVCWRWHTPGYRSTFGGEAVNRLAWMVARHYPHPHRVVCVTDDPSEIDQSKVGIIPDRKDFADLPSPHGGRNPSCYRRLRLYGPDAGKDFGERYVSIDIDAVITGDLSPLWNRTEDVVFWGDHTNPQPGSYYNGSMQLMTPGARPQVWSEFNPDPSSPTYSPRVSLGARAYGSDQGWISYCLGPRPSSDPRGEYPGEAKWTKADGVYSFNRDIHPNIQRLPAGCRITFWHGHVDPWSDYASQIGWVRRHYYGEGQEQATA